MSCAGGVTSVGTTTTGLRALRQQASELVRQTEAGATVAISSVSLAELHLGVLVARSDASRAERLRRFAVIERAFDALPVDKVVAREYGRLATATAHDATLWARNAADPAQVGTYRVGALIYAGASGGWHSSREGVVAGVAAGLNVGRVSTRPGALQSVDCASGCMARCNASSADLGWRLCLRKV
jgi:predicted nucleic acid-binding protein